MYRHCRLSALSWCIDRIIWNNEQRHQNEPQSDECIKKQWKSSNRPKFNDVLLESVFSERHISHWLEFTPIFLVITKHCLEIYTLTVNGYGAQNETLKYYIDLNSGSFYHFHAIQNKPYTPFIYDSIGRWVCFQTKFLSFIDHIMLKWNTDTQNIKQSV